MTAAVGRTITVYWGNESPQPAVAGIREKGITVSGEAVDITNDDSNGWRELLDAAQVNGVEISCSGVLLDDVLRADMVAGASATGRRMQAATFEYPDGGTVAGTFYLQEYSETGNHDGEVTFEATFMSNGVVTYTPAA
jgi:TP901-1 family phage major tail protein